MADLHAVRSPRISESTLKRLMAFARATRLTANSTAFDTGYERCKQDLTDILRAEVGETPEHDIREAARQNTSSESKRWWFK